MFKALHKDNAHKIVTINIFETSKKKSFGSGVFFAKMSFSLRRESHLASAIEQEYNKLIQF